MLTAVEMRDLFSAIDTNGSGFIDYEEFMDVLNGGGMNPERRKLIQLAFKTLDSKGAGYLDLDNLTRRFNALKHPEVQSGKLTEEEALKEFIQAISASARGRSITCKGRMTCFKHD